MTHEEMHEDSRRPAGADQAKARHHDLRKGDPRVHDLIAEIDEAIDRGDEALVERLSEEASPARPDGRGGFRHLSRLWPGVAEGLASPDGLTGGTDALPARASGFRPLPGWSGARWGASAPSSERSS